MEELELLRKWLEALMAALDAEVDGKTRAQVMEHCGQACAIHLGSIKKAQAIKHGAKGIGELLDKLNQQDGFWCGRWVKDGATIYSICGECGCPLIRAGLVELSPTFCDCSRGWVKVVFETLLERSVEVELEQAIGRGDDPKERAAQAAIPTYRPLRLPVHTTPKHQTGIRCAEAFAEMTTGALLIILRTPRPPPANRTPGRPRQPSPTKTALAPTPRPPTMIAGSAASLSQTVQRATTGRAARLPAAGLAPGRPAMPKA